MSRGTSTTVVGPDVQAWFDDCNRPPAVTEPFDVPPDERPLGDTDWRHMVRDPLFVAAVFKAGPKCLTLSSGLLSSVTLKADGGRSSPFTDECVSPEWPHGWTVARKGTNEWYLRYRTPYCVLNRRLWEPNLGEASKRIIELAAHVPLLSRRVRSGFWLGKRVEDGAMVGGLQIRRTSTGDNWVLLLDIEAEDRCVSVLHGTSETIGKQTHDWLASLVNVEG